MFSFIYSSAWGTWAYLAACGLLWLFLTALWVGSLQPGFPGWLASHPRLMVALLGTDRMPAKPSRTLTRFYFFLAGGWTWILAWSWWLGPLIKEQFFRDVTTTKAYEIARISTIIVVAAYAATGFFAIGKAVSIWFKEIYAPSPNPGVPPK